MIKNSGFLEHELFSQAFRYAPIGMALVSTEGQWLHVNSSLCQFLGYSQSEFAHHTFQDITHPDDLDMCLELRNRLLNDKMSSYQFEKRYIHKSGFTVWALLAVSIVRDERRQPLFFIAQIKDISENKLSEEELKTKKEQLDSFFHNNADAIWMINLDDTVLKVNPRFETMFGWPTEDIIGKKLPIIPDFLQDTMEKKHQQIKAGESIIGLETIRLRMDRELIDVEATLSPIRDPDGGIIGITGICRDITRRKRAEEELRAKKSQLESFIENHADAILIFCKNGVIQTANRAFEDVFGWSKEEIIGLELPPLPFVPPECIDESKQLREKLEQGQSTVSIETIRRNKNGDMLNIVLTAAPILDGKGNRDGYSVTLRDITEWKTTQEHLQNSEKLTVAGQLAAGIAHEIRNPMTAIKGFIHLMRAGFGEKQKYYEIMSSEIERIELILSELLILAKPQSIKFERKDIRVMLSQVMTLLDTQAILNNVQFVTEYKPGITHIYCDENQLKQVFINFIKNSIESMPEGGKITVEINRDGQQEMLIRLTDQGCGIPKVVLDKLGQPFYTTKEKGTGLGFMVSKQIIENHSGRIQVASEVNKGTTIEVRLPMSSS